MIGSRSNFECLSAEPGKVFVNGPPCCLKPLMRLLISDRIPLPRLLHFVLSKPLPTLWNLEHLNIVTAETAKHSYHEGHEEHEEELFGPSIGTWNLGSEMRTES